MAYFLLKMPLTKKTHINPCFWSALWNESYHNHFLAGEKSKLRARESQLIFLEINSNKILRLKAEDVFFEKDLGLAPITPEKALEFCKRHYADKYEELSKEIESRPETLILDFENIISGLENLPIYGALINLARTGRITTEIDKSWIALFTTHHQLRSHEYLQKLIKSYEAKGRAKFEALIELKWALSSLKFMAEESLIAFKRKWTLYRTPKKIIPLSDAPIVGTPHMQFVTVAPDTLITIEYYLSDGLGIEYKQRIPNNIYNLFVRSVIQYATKGLVFFTEKDAEKCKERPAWNARRREYQRLKNQSIPM